MYGFLLLPRAEGDVNKVLIHTRSNDSRVLGSHGGNNRSCHLVQRLAKYYRNVLGSQNGMLPKVRSRGRYILAHDFSQVSLNKSGDGAMKVKWLQ